jgi:PAS domain S-box-containing protein
MVIDFAPQQTIVLSDLIDIPVFQGLADSFSHLTGMPLAILDLSGHIFIASGWRRICMEFHRKHPKATAQCRESDTVLAGSLSKGGEFTMYRCKNGLIDVVTPIIIENMHLGNLYIGQFLLEEPDRRLFERQAEQFGFDKETYLEALSEVTVHTENQVREAMAHFINLTVVIASAGLAGKKLLELNRSLETKVRERTLRLEIERNFSESLVKSLPGVMYMFDEFGRIKKWNENFEKISGYSAEDIVTMKPLDFIVEADRPKIKDTIGQGFSQGKTSVEARVLTHSGNMVPFLFTGFKYIQDQRPYLIGVGIDISNRVKAEQDKAVLIEQLQASLSKIKKLSGLLPICSSCKKIRDDKGYWNQIESYIHEHSEAEFSHGLCPDCIDKLYGKQSWYLRGGKKNA